jgi:hypothetical protein
MIVADSSVKRDRDKSAKQHVLVPGEHLICPIMIGHVLCPRHCGGLQCQGSQAAFFYSRSLGMGTECTPGIRYFFSFDPRFSWPNRWLFGEEISEIRFFRVFTRGGSLLQGFKPGW